MKRNKLIYCYCFVLLSMLIISSCSVVKKRYSFGYNVHWKKSSDSKFKKITSSPNKEYSAKKSNNSKISANVIPEKTVAIDQLNNIQEDSLINDHIRIPNSKVNNRFVSVLNNPLKTIDNKLNNTLRKEFANVKLSIQEIKDIRKEHKENKAVYIDYELIATILMTIAGIGAILFLLGLYWSYKNLYSNLVVPFVWTGLGIMGICLASVIILRIISLILNW